MSTGQMVEQIILNDHLSNTSNPIEYSSASASNVLEELLEELYCPITGTGEVMIDPVQGNDGHTYEREAIENWLLRNKTSPQTREFMDFCHLKSNLRIKSLCEKYHNGEFGAIMPKAPKMMPKISSEEILLDHELMSDGKDNILLKFQIDKSSIKEENFKNLPQDIVIVVDHSGSMGADIVTTGNSESKKEDGFSVQDITNHGCKTCIASVDEKSRVAIIKFDSTIEVVSDLKEMNSINKKELIERINTITPNLQTNLYGAIERAVKLLDERTDKSRNGAILVFTDGVPNINPARGVEITLKKLRITKNFTSPIYIFGFGYNLQNGLLYNISKIANGGMGHIPDGTMIATVFCNFISTILTTIVVNLQLHVLSKDILVKGDYEFNYDNEKKEMIYDLGTVQYEQSRDIILFNFEDLKNVDYYFTYKIGGKSYNSGLKKIDVNKLHSETQEYKILNVNINKLRCELVELIRELITQATFRNYNEISNLIEVFHQKLETHQLLYHKNDEEYKLIQGMIDNLVGNQISEGQIKLAVKSHEYFKKWGEFYLDQLSRSLNQQIKPNFKDKSCMFGGEIFEEFVDKASDIFDNLPPPLPSNINRRSFYNSTMGLPITPPAPPVALGRNNAFNDPTGGCYDGSSLIKIGHNKFKQVKDLKRGDEVISINTDNKEVKTKVVFVVKTNFNNNIKLCKIKNKDSELLITNWHPIYVNEEWIFPRNLVKDHNSNLKEVYNLVLEDYHKVYVNNILCICLGHKYKEGILKHAYFGSDKVYYDLNKVYNYQKGENGLVEIKSDWFIRNSENLVERIIMI